MKGIARYLPYPIFKRLFGDRKRYGGGVDPADPSWIEWQEKLMRFYESTQKSGLGKRVNDAGYAVLRRVDFEGKIVCEIGPGTLPHLAFWNGKPREYIAVDVSEAFLAATRRRLEQEVRCVCRPVVVDRASPALPLESESVDIVVSFYSLEHLTPLGGHLDEVYRILKPGGLLVGAVPNEGGFLWGLGRFLTSRRWVRKHTTIDYDKIICWEHPNFLDDIWMALQKRFDCLSAAMAPFAFLPLADVNLVTKFIFRKNGPRP